MVLPLPSTFRLTDQQHRTKHKKANQFGRIPVGYCWLALRLLYLLYGKALVIIL